MAKTLPSKQAIGTGARADRPDSVGPVTLIAPTRGWRALDLAEIWAYRELLGFLVWRDVKVRYQQTALGATWAVLQPVAMMVLFTLVFGRLAGMPNDGVPYPLLVFSGLLPWQLFAHALSESGNSLVANQHLVTKVYFPRLVIPLAAVLAGLVDFAIQLVVLLGMMVMFGVWPTARALALPALALLALAAALAVGLWLSALNVRYRDVRYTLPFLTQVWLYASPIGYTSSSIPEAWRPLYALNPMAGVVEGFRWALLGVGDGLSPSTIVSTLSVAAILFGGLFYFRRTERTFADIV